MPYNSKAFGTVIGRLRTEKGLTQERMSGLSGIARSHLAELENGNKTVKLNTLWNIAYALDMKPSELVRLVEKETETDGAASDDLGALKAVLERKRVLEEIGRLPIDIST